MTVVASGELDIAVVPTLREVLTEAVAGGVGDVIIDFSEVSFLGAAPLGPMATTAARLAADGRRLIVQSASPQVARVFTLTGLAHLLDVR
jgi:anti-anti-sigma factor